MSRVIRGLAPLVWLTLSEVFVYLILFRGYPLAHYAFLWTAIMIGALLLKLTGSGGAETPSGVMRSTQQLALIKLKKLFPGTYHKPETTGLEDVFEIISYVIMIAANAAIVYFVG